MRENEFKNKFELKCVLSASISMPKIRCAFLKSYSTVCDGMYSTQTFYVDDENFTIQI